MATNIFVYIGRMDWGVGHLTIIVGTGGGTFANKNCPQSCAFDHFFQMSRVCRGGMLGLEDSHIIPLAAAFIRGRRLIE